MPTTTEFGILPCCMILAQVFTIYEHFCRLSCKPMTLAVWLCSRDSKIVFQLIRKYTLNQGNMDDIFQHQHKKDLKGGIIIIFSKYS